MLHDAAVPSGRVSSIDSSSSNSIRSGARITAPAPVKRQTLMSFFVNPAARSGMVVARDKPVVATQAADVGNRWWDEDEEEQIDDEAEKRERTKRANESAQAWAKFFLRITPPAPVASSFATTLHEDLAQMQRTSEKPDTLRSEKRGRNWLKDGAKHGDFSRGEGLEALKQAQSIAKEEQAKNLTIGAISEKKAKSLAIAAANRATGVPRKTIKRHLAADLTCGVAKKGPKPILDRNEHGICSGNRAESRSGWGRECVDQAHFGQPSDPSRPARAGQVLAASGSGIRAQYEAAGLHPAAKGPPRLTNGLGQLAGKKRQAQAILRVPWGTLGYSAGTLRVLCGYSGGTLGPVR